MTAIVEQKPHPPRVKKWTKEEYLDLIEHGAFRNQRVYLFRGDIIEMAPQGHPHAFAIKKLNRYLTDVFKEPYDVAIQLPFITPGQSVPEPDAAVSGPQDAPPRSHASRAELVVEVAYSSLKQDRALTAEYAAAQVPEYWIIDVEGRRIEVYRSPREDATALYGYSYGDMRVLNVGDQIAPLNQPAAAIPVGNFFV